MSKTSPSGLRIIVSGLVGQYPMGGVAWDYLQYVIGLRLLGHDVYYIEDTGQWPYSPHENRLADDPTWTVAYLNDVMIRFGLEERWAYRFPRTGRWYGIAPERRNDVVATADLVLNVSGVLRDPQSYRRRGTLVFIDTDPVFTQLKLSRGQADYRAFVDQHDQHFSFGEMIERSRSREIPDTGHIWRPTRQPVVLDEWQTQEPPSRTVFTTVMNWTSYKPIVFEGRAYGQKDVEMKRFMELPSTSEVPLELAVSPGKTRGVPRGLLERHGWGLVDPMQVCATADDYRDYIQGSMAEWSVAKGGYVTGRSGWFSCRTACYLAAGRPAVVQDTGFSAVLPTGRGVISFATSTEASEGIAAVVADYRAHSTAAREVAREYFDARVVLADLVDRSMATGRVAEIA